MIVEPEDSGAVDRPLPIPADMLNRLGGGAAIVDRFGMVVFANPYICALAGAGKGDLGAVQRHLNQQSGFKPAMNYLASGADSVAWLRVATANGDRDWLLLQAIRKPGGPGSPPLPARSCAARPSLPEAARRRCARIAGHVRTRHRSGPPTSSPRFDPTRTTRDEA